MCEEDSLVIEFWQLIAQDHSMVHASSCNGDQVDDTPTRAVPVHGQSDSCRGVKWERGREKGLLSKITSFPSIHKPTTTFQLQAHLLERQT